MTEEERWEKEARDTGKIKVWPDGTDEFDHARFPVSLREWAELEHLARTNEAAMRRWIHGIDSLIAQRFPERLLYTSVEVAVQRCHELVERLKLKQLSRLAKRQSQGYHRN